MSPNNPPIQSAKNWYVYMVRCADNSLYTGVTTDLNRREYEHNHSNKLGAKYTKSRRPVAMVYQHSCQSRQQACQQEYQLKQLTKLQKERLVADYPAILEIQPT